MFRNDMGHGTGIDERGCHAQCMTCRIAEFKEAAVSCNSHVQSHGLRLVHPVAPCKKKLCQDFSRRRAFRPDIFVPGKMRIGNMVINIQYIPMDE